jgi:hypothetical protein
MIKSKKNRALLICSVFIYLIYFLFPSTSIKAMNFNIADQDITAPRVIEAGFVYDNKSSDPNYLTFYAKVYENGSGIEDVIVYYYFLEAESVGIGTSLDQEEYQAQMELVN